MDALDVLKRPRKEACPSDLVLSQFDAGALPQPVRAEIEQHVAACSDCKAWLDDGRAAFSKLSTEERAPILDAMVAASRARPSWQRRLPAIASIAAAAAVLTVLLVPRSDPDRGLTPKGGPVALRIYREHEGKVSRALPGEKFNPKDRLRFEVDLERPGHVMIVGVEASGHLYSCFPARGEDSALLPFGTKQLLPDTVELDDSRGKETLFLVECPSRFRLSELKASGDSLSLPQTCLLARFAIDKGGP
ncbi:MAG: hypothetical protein U1E65_34400 [Myxococcota bacterium]